MALALGCSDDDEDTTDAGGRDAGADAAEADGGLTDPAEVARRLADLERKLRETEQRLTDLQTPAGDSDLLTHLAQPLLAATCARAERCCATEELVLELGEGVSSAQACEAMLLSLAQRATSLNVNVVSTPIFQLVSEALALQKSNAFEVDAAGVQVCADKLASTACERVDDGRCHSPDRDDPCLPARLLRSVARSGDTCEVGTSLPKCGPGLSCKALARLGGRCVKAGMVGDGCVQDGDCANEELFCSPTTSRCERLRELRETCGNPSSPTPESKCARGLVCDSRVCVPACEAGAACDLAHDNGDCAPGLVCSSDAKRCYPPQHECARDSECAAGARCTPIASSDGPWCSRVLSPGDVCNQYVASCDNGYCVSDPEKGSVCKARCAGDEACANDQYCANRCSLLSLCPPDNVGCVPRVSDGSWCGGQSDISDARLDRQCVSGNCDRATSTCQPKRTPEAACERSAQCPSTQYCEAGMCRPLAAAGADCTGLNLDACGTGAFCRTNAGQHTCTPTPHLGDACDLASGLVCPDGTGLKCLAQHCLPEHGRALDAWCTENSVCASGFCRRPSEKCENRTTERAVCNYNPPSPRDDECEAGLYCGESHKCTRRGSAGTSCQAKFNGRDCFSKDGPFEPGHCIERESEWRCAADALAPGSALCDGQ